MTSPRPTPEQLQELRAKAEAATPGPWEFHYDCSACGRDAGVCGSEVPVVTHGGKRILSGKDWASAQFVADANPQTILSLLSYIAALERENELLEGQHND